MSQGFRPQILLSRMAYGLSFNSNLASSVVGGLPLTKDDSVQPPLRLFEMYRGREGEENGAFTHEIELETNDTCAIRIVITISNSNSSCHGWRLSLRSAVLSLFGHQESPKPSDLFQNSDGVRTAADVRHGRMSLIVSFLYCCANSNITSERQHLIHQTLFFFMRCRP